jgi:5-methylcytosine-specific restriction endonuclease McrA
MTTSRAKADPLRMRCRRALGSHRERARADGQDLPYGLRELEELARAAQTCFYCKRPVGWDFQFDHKTPTSRGGAHTLANIEICCPECNSAKGGMDSDEFLALLSLLRGFHPRSYGDVLGRLRAGGRRYAGRGG